MAKRVTYNGIELALPKYDETALPLFNYIDNVITNLEKGLDKNDGNFQLSINVDFAADKPPKYSFHANGASTKKTKEKVANILKKTAQSENERVSGSVKVNLMVQDKDR